eukprot:COSAG04_NODE_1062_length_8500_cov_11.838353_9_plen_176_part_01
MSAPSSLARSGRKGRVAASSTRASSRSEASREQLERDMDLLDERSGRSQQELEDLQRFLRSHGAYAGMIDGQWGDETEAAVRKYQRARNLVVDGVAGRNFKLAMEVEGVQRFLQCYGYFALRRGSDGKVVKADGSDGRVDGRMDDKSKAAVRKYQQETGLNVDGIAAGNTKAQIMQ